LSSIFFRVFFGGGKAPKKGEVKEDLSIINIKEKRSDLSENL